MTLLNSVSVKYDGSDITNGFVSCVITVSNRSPHAPDVCLAVSAVSGV